MNIYMQTQFYIVSRKLTAKKLRVSTCHRMRPKEKNQNNIKNEIISRTHVVEPQRHRA